MPADVVQMLGAQALADTQEESRALQDAVRSQTKAKQELHRVRQARRTFLEAWAHYAAQLLITVEEQVEDQSLFLKRWPRRSASSCKAPRPTATLSKLSGVPQVDLDRDVDSVATGSKAMEVTDP